MIKEILNRNLTLLSKNLESYVSQFGFKTVLKEAIYFDKVDGNPPNFNRNRE